MEYLTCLGKARVGQHLVRGTDESGGVGEDNTEQQKTKVLRVFYSGIYPHTLNTRRDEDRSVNACGCPCNLVASSAKYGISGHRPAHIDRPTLRHVHDEGHGARLYCLLCARAHLLPLSEVVHVEKVPGVDHKQSEIGVFVWCLTEAPGLYCAAGRSSALERRRWPYVCGRAPRALGAARAARSAVAGTARLRMRRCMNSKSTKPT